MSNYYDRYESGAVDIGKAEDKALLEHLRRCYEADLVDVETEAVFDPVANSGSFTIEVVLLRKVGFCPGTQGTFTARNSSTTTPRMLRLAARSGR